MHFQSIRLRLYRWVNVSPTQIISADSQNTEPWNEMLRPDAAQLLELGYAGLFTPYSTVLVLVV